MWKQARRHADWLLEEGQERFSLRPGYVGDYALLRSVQHWARMDGLGRDSAGAALGVDRVGFAQWSYAVYDELRRLEQGLVGLRDAAIALLACRDWNDGRYTYAETLARCVGTASEEEAMRRWDLEVLKEAFGGESGLATLREVVADVAALHNPAQTPEWLELAAL